MKIRTGFVSNSSASSFVCEICGREEITWDGFGDLGMVECVNEHLFCEDDVDLDEIEGEIEDWPYGIPEEYCPICQFEIFRDYDMVRYLMKETGIPLEEAFAEIKKLNKRRKKIKDAEYVTYVVTKNGMNLDDVKNFIRSVFANYEAFWNYIIS